MAQIQVNFDGCEDTEILVDLKEWHGKQMGREYIVEAIQRIISGFENFEDHGPVAYSLCGDTLIVVTLDDNAEYPYTVMVSKVTHRGRAKRV